LFDHPSVSPSSANGATTKHAAQQWLLTRGVRKQSPWCVGCPRLPGHPRVHRKDHRDRVAGGCKMHTSADTEKLSGGAPTLGAGQRTAVWRCRGAGVWPCSGSRTHAAPRRPTSRAWLSWGGGGGGALPGGGSRALPAGGQQEGHAWPRVGNRIHVCLEVRVDNATRGTKHLSKETNHRRKRHNNENSAKRRL